MWTLYENILSLCTERGIKGGKMCVDLGLSKSLMTDLKSGRKKGITSDTAQRIADYFSVSVDRVLNGPEAKKAPTIEQKDDLSCLARLLYDNLGCLSTRKSNFGSFLRFNQSREVAFCVF